MINEDTMDNTSKTHTETLSAACRQTHSGTACASTLADGDCCGQRRITAPVCAEGVVCVCVCERECMK